MDTIYFKVIGLILVMPWGLVGLTAFGYLRARIRRRALRREPSPGGNPSWTAILKPSP